MNEHNYQKELDNALTLMFSQGPSEAFERCWDLYKETAYISNPKGIYFRISRDGTYRNIVIAGENGIVDIEADESSGADRDISVSPYRALSGVILHMGPIQTIQRTQNSLLTVACLVGTTSIGPYWSAHSEEEVDRLRNFSRTLVKALSL